MNYLFQDILIYCYDWVSIQSVCCLWRLIAHKACAKVSEPHHEELFLPSDAITVTKLFATRDQMLASSRSLGPPLISEFAVQGLSDLLVLAHRQHTSGLSI